ncbi:MAG: 2-amino-4-oxopentanoate thiolase subunit OrtA [Chloroflexota bacterium]|nr:2-amino-4-oxopentanoate thiolase subunit OrtA [Chloroflexota bacterium]
MADSRVVRTDAGPVPSGSWVEIEQVVLRAGQRAPNVPADTAAVDFVARIRGFLLADASMGADATIRTLAGREVGGRLTAVNPRNTADFGNPVPELLQLGLAARRALEAGRGGS